MGTDEGKAMMRKASMEYQAVSGMDAAERERVLMEQLPEVRYMARRIHDRLPSHVPLDDLISAGILGLIDALHKYDAGKNVQFKSYARFRIRGAILDSLREMDWSPRDLRRKARSLEQANRKLAGELGRAPSELELAGELGMELSEYQRLLGELRGLDLGSLVVQNPETEREEEICERVPQVSEEDPFSLCLQSEMKTLLARAIGELPERERQVLNLYYFEELTLKEVGAVLGVHESRVSQIHSQIMVRLRGRLAEPLRQRRPAPVLKSAQYAAEA
jgi:RNA polymerase sigma factor for flagellar operon FliA